MSEIAMKTLHKNINSMCGKKFLYAEALDPSTDLILTIKAVIEERIENPADGTFDVKPVLYFEEIDEALALNDVNRKTVISVTGTVMADEMIGKRIQIFATTTKAFGQVMPCIRIRNFVPELKCSVCGKVIDENTYYGSIKKYGKPYCGKECLEKSKNGEQLL